MSTISSNPFALLSGGDSDDEGGATRSAAVKSTKASIAVAPQPKKTIPGQQAKRDRGDYPARGAPRKVYGGQSTGAETEVIGSKPAGVTEHGRDDRAERRGAPRGGRGTRGRGAGRGRGGARFEDRPDRHSATGTHDTDRKVASGWGAEEGKQELQAETEGYGDAKAALTPADGDDGWGAKADDGAPVTNGHAKNGEGGDFRDEEEEDKTKTFEEYLAEKANAALALPSLKKGVRKPNEGADDSQWKDAVKLVKGEEEEEVFFQAKEKKTTQTTKKIKEKTFIEVEPLGYRPPRAGGDRGGRGRGRGRGDRDGGPDRRDYDDNRGAPRGGRGRGGPRDGMTRGPKELNTEDANAFPSLS